MWGTSHLGLDVVCVLPGKLLLTGRRDQNVTVGLEDVALVRRGIGKADDRAVLLQSLIRFIFYFDKINHQSGHWPVNGWHYWFVPNGSVAQGKSFSSLYSLWVITCSQARK